MAYSLTWLADVLRAAGLKVVEQPNWKTRGHGDMGAVKGIICHHTAGGKTGNAPSLGIVQNGRPDLSGPLSQLVLGRDGTYYVVAAGLCYHAGAGNWKGVKSGNTSFIGIEAENTGLSNDPWPEVQMVAYRRGVAAILKKIGAPVNMCCGHKEYALPKGRKPDPSFSMDNFRSQVSALMGASATPIPARPVHAFEAKAPKIMRDLISDFGLTETQAAGILGNIGHECGGFTLMQEQRPTSGIGGYGWAQWTGPRRKDFFAWCKAHGLTTESDAGNYGFLKHELQTSEAKSIRAVKGTASLNDAMLAFEKSFERAGIKHYDSRLAYTNRAFTAYRNSVKSGVTAETGTAGGILAGGGAAATVAAQQGMSWGTIAIIVVMTVLVAVVIYFAIRSMKKD